MTEPDQVDGLCAMCDKQGVHACSGCRAIRYCSKGCQKADWTLHKILCKTYKSFSEATRPPPNNNIWKRAIYFPEHGDSPLWTWMRFYGPCASGRAIVERNWAGVDCSGIQVVNEIPYNETLKRNFNRSIGVVGNGWPLASENMDHAGTQNKSLMKIDPELSEWFHGPLLVVGHNGSIVPDEPGTTVTKVPYQDQVYDLEPIDFRHVVDRMRSDYYRSGQETKMYTGIESDEKVKGVRANCKGDVSMCFQPVIKEVDVIKSLCATESDIEASVAEKVGIPLVIKKIPHALCWRGRYMDGMKCSKSTSVPLLDLQTHYELYRGFGIEKAKSQKQIDEVCQLVMKQDEDMGSCVIVRRDGKPLAAKFVRGLIAYANKKEDDAIFSLRKEGGSLTEDILAGVTKEDWEEFYANYVDEV